LGSSHSQNNPPSEALWNVRALFFHQNAARATITKLSSQEELFALLAGDFDLARPERLELPTLWFEAQFRPTRSTTPDIETQQNKGKSRGRVACFCTLLPTVLGQFSDSLVVT